MLRRVDMGAQREDFLQFAAMYMLSRKSYMIPRAVLMAEYFRKYKRRFNESEQKKGESDFSTFTADAEFFEEGLTTSKEDEFDQEARVIGFSIYERICSILSEKERYIVEHLMRGLTCSEIGNQLGVSLSRISQIRAEIIRKCLRLGIVTKKGKFRFTSSS